MKYIRISRDDHPGARCTVPVPELPGVIQGEFDDIEWVDVGTTIHLEVVEMTEDEYAALPVFQGW